MARFRLLSKNSNVDAISSISYGYWNKKEDIPSYFYKINSKIFANGKPDSDFEIVIQMVRWLCEHTRVGPGLSEASAQALKTMLYGKGGVCSDMAQIFNNFCLINDIEVREWGTTSAPFNRANGGHAFNEVFINDLKKWILIDPSWGGYFKDSQEQVLSVIELYSISRSGEPVYYESLIKGKDIPLELINKNYLNSDITPFLICAYRNKTYDRFLKVARPYLPVFIIHFFVYISGKSYHYKFPLDDYKTIFT
jgi:hypothetical protein